MSASNTSRVIHCLILGVSFLLPMAVARMCRADSSDGEDETEKSYYWQGAQLNNLSRLANPDPNFEETQRKARLDKTQDSYLAKIRAQISHQAATDADKKALLMQGGQLSSDPLEVVYTPSGIDVTLHAEMLFSENTAFVKQGAVDILDRLRGILQKANDRPLRFVIADRLDEVPDANRVDAERAQMIVALLKLPEKGTRQEELNPEPLASQ